MRHCPEIVNRSLLRSTARPSLRNGQGNFPIGIM
jgi:hypothetical protein